MARPVVQITELLRTERSFRWLWLGQVVSELGDWFQLVALVSMFPTDGRGASVVAGLFVGRNLVAALVTPLAGVVADRFHRGRVMIGMDLARALVVLGFLLVRGPQDVLAIYALSFLLEALTIVFEPARGAAIPQVLPPTKLYAANTLSSATWSSVLALGALAGGIAASRLGRDAAFAVNSITFVASAVFVALARVPALPDAKREHASPPHPLRELRDGIDYLRANRAQRALLVLKPGALLSGGAFVLVTVFADRVFPGDHAETMGWLLAGRGLGALVMPFVVRRFAGGDVRGLVRGVWIAIPLAVAGFLAFAGAPGVALAALALLFAHGGTSALWVASTQLLQLTVPNRVLGRVLSVELALVTIAIAGSMAFVAGLLDRGGVAPRAAGVALAALLLLPLAVWARSGRRHLAALEEAARERPPS